MLLIPPLFMILTMNAINNEPIQETHKLEEPILDKKPIQIKKVIPNIKLKEQTLNVERKKLRNLLKRPDNTKEKIISKNDAEVLDKSPIMKIDEYEKLEEANRIEAPILKEQPKIKIDTSNSEYLRAFIHDTNELQIIRNKHLINNLLLTEANKNSRSDKKSTVPKFLVILIQIHSRFTYLKELIMSLKNTRHIEDTLVIFSHDVYNEEMNDLIKNIKFCAVSTSLLIVL